MNKPSERERAEEITAKIVKGYGRFSYEDKGIADLIEAALIQAKVEGERVGSERAAVIVEKWGKSKPKWPEMDAAAKILARRIRQETGEGEGSLG